MLQEFVVFDDMHKDSNWRQLILEYSFFYNGLILRSDGPARVSYMNIGRTMYEKYPKIAAKGNTPWVHSMILYFGLSNREIMSYVDFWPCR